VHDGTLGSSAHPEVPPYGVWRDERSVYIDVPGVKLADAGYKLGAEIASAYRSVVFMPLTVRADMNFAGHRFIVLFHPSPLGPTRIRNFTVAIINSPADPEMLRAALIGGLRTVYGQDRPIVESQRPQELPEDLSYELHIKGADAFFLVYRRFLFDLARELAVRACA
jgi:vanillate O-demethylase monooxygenase subunit